MLTRFRKIPYIMAYAVATIPLWHYIRDGRILALMVAVVTFAYINVVLSTVEAAQPILSSEKAKIPLPRWLPNNPKYHTWWMLVRHTLRWHLLLVVPKMGLALGFVQYFYLSGNPYWVQYHWMQSNYDYYGFYGFSDGIINPSLLLYPQFITIIIAVFVMTVFTICEIGFISSIITLAHSMSTTLKNVLRVLSLRLMFIFAMLGLTMFTRDIIHLYKPRTQTQDAVICSFIGYDLIYMHYADREIATEKCRLKVLETVNTGLLTSLEQSVLLSANIMRPVRPEDWTDNRLFVARQIVAGVLGLLLYAGATWTVLWFVEDEVVRE